MPTLLMLSGGADSAAALVKLLTENKDPVFCHHIIISDRESRTRFKAEDIACNSVVKYCRQQYRDFTFTKSLWDFPLRYFGWNLTLCAFVGARVLRSFPEARIDRYAVGVIDEPHMDRTGGGGQKHLLCRSDYRQIAIQTGNYLAGSAHDKSRYP